MEKKKSIILTIVAVATLIALVVGATFAYFQATGGQAANADVKVTTYTTDLLTFTTGDPITIYADQSNFASGSGNRSGDTFARAHLLANNKTNTATDNYYVYLDITNNNFEYTQGSTPELLLQVTDPNGVEVTTLSGLEYKSVIDGKGQTIKGFDVTTAQGLITLVDNHEISANPDTTQTWNVTIVFVNLDADQTKNTGKTLSAILTITKDTMNGTLADYVKSQYTGVQGENNIYFHNGTILGEDGTILDAEDNSYRYAGSSDTTNNFVCFGNEETTCPDDNLYRIIGVFEDKVKLIKWDYATSAQLGTDGDYGGTYSQDASYYQGDSSNLTNIAGYYWNKTNYDASIEATGYCNHWSYSELNKIHLNKNYLANIGNVWTTKIVETTWKVGGNTWENIAGSAMNVVYQNEIVAPAENTNYNAKIGLVYVSEYAYATSPIYWTNLGYDYSSTTDFNWMYMGLLEWTVVRRSDVSSDTFDVDSSFILFGNGIIFRGVVDNAPYAVRPVFYLNSDVTYKSGTGTKTDPITINLD